MEVRSTRGILCAKKVKTSSTKKGYQSDFVSDELELAAQHRERKDNAGFDMTNLAPIK
jgi:hypothetical protein